MPTSPRFPILIFYDGSCSVCSTEIEYYLSKDHEERLTAVDISSPGFDPSPFHINREAFMHELHVIDQRGEVYRGIDAFWAIWQAFPVSSLYGILGFCISMPIVNFLARLLYKGFARIRPWLPKKHNCSGGACIINKRG